MPPVETDARSVPLALYVPADLDAQVEQARERAGLDRSKFIRSCVTRQAKMPVRGVDPIQAGPKVRRNVRWHPDEIALVDAYAAAAWQEHGRRLGVEDAAVELLHVAIVDPPESVASPAPARPSGELRDLVAEVVREELRPVLDLLRSINAAPVLDAGSLAAGLYDLVGPMLVDAVKGSARGGRPAQLAAVGVVGVARVVDALRVAHEAADYAGKLPDHEARRVLSRAVIDAVADLQGIPPDPAPAPPVSAARPVEVRTQTDTEPIPADVGELTRSFLNIGVNRRKSSSAKPGGRRKADPK